MTKKIHALHTHMYDQNYWHRRAPQQRQTPPICSDGGQAEKTERRRPRSREHHHFLLGGRATEDVHPTAHTKGKEKT